jgi:hypothetical protein
MESKSTVSSKNQLAITSLVLGIAPVCITILLIMTYRGYAISLLGVVPVGVVAISSFAAIITGAISLNQIKKQGRSGKNLAITGITFGTLTLGTILLFPLLFFLALIGFFGGKGI